MEEQLLFSDREEFRQWLSMNHDTSPGVWLVIGKSGIMKTVKADEALEEALCFGWIDVLSRCQERRNEDKTPGKDCKPIERK